jgi:hypothetical protein
MKLNILLVIFLGICFLCIIETTFSNTEDHLTAIGKQLSAFQEEQKQICGNWLEQHFKQTPPRESHRLIFMQSPGSKYPFFLSFNSVHFFVLQKEQLIKSLRSLRFSFFPFCSIGHSCCTRIDRRRILS